MTVEPTSSPELPDLPETYRDVRDTLLDGIRAAQGQALAQANVLRNVSYLMVGRALGELQPDSHSATYGKRVVEEMSRDLSAAFPGSSGYSPTNLRYARRFASVLASVEIHPQLGANLDAVPLVRLPWGHIKALLDAFQQEPLVMAWYASEAAANGWSRAALLNQISGRAHERAGKALTNVAVTAPDSASELMEQMGKDPLLFDFLGLSGKVRERELEDALVGQLAKLMTELGRGFLWAGRQQRLVLTDPETGQEKEFFTDLLFYHHPSRRWLVIDFKIDEFEYGDAMQVGLYTHLIDDQRKSEHDLPTVGMVLCPSRHRALADALSVLNTPTFITTYTLGAEVAFSALPRELRSALPDQDAIEGAVASVLDEAGASE